MTQNVADFEALVSGTMLVGTRISGLLLVAPFFGGASIPVRIKATLAIALTVLLAPVVRPPVIPHSIAEWTARAVAEVFAGAVLGLTFQFVLDGVQFAGQLMGLQMGFSLVNLMDPQTQVDTPVLSIFHQLAGLLIFLQLDVHHWLLRAIARSFTYLPAGTVVVSRVTCWSIVQCAGGLLLLGCQMAAPVLLATLVIDLALGFVGKASPQLPVLMIGLSLKSLTGLALAAGLMAMWPRLLERAFAGALTAAEHMLHLAA